MIANQKIGKSFMGALGYNLRKLHHPDPALRAKLLDTNFGSLDKAQIKREVDIIRELRPNLNRYVYHTSLNFPKDENLPDEVLVTIAHQYLEANGFTNNQYFIFRHFDADHPHLHLLVNRICFDGSVVSDSNNYKKSEQILRSIERQYNLVQVSRSEYSPVRAATKDELEMVIRTGQPSDKMLLQEKLSLILQRRQSMPDFIRQCELNGIHLLFNQQSSGRISGVTYCFEGMVMKGQKLGNRFKWSELVKRLDYEQIRDGKAISEANGRTRSTYGWVAGAAGQQGIGTGGDGLYPGGAALAANEHRQPGAYEETGSQADPNRAGSLAADQDADPLYRDTADPLYRDTFDLDIQIAEDVDDEKVYGKRRRRGR